MPRLGARKWQKSGANRAIQGCRWGLMIMWRQWMAFVEFGPVTTSVVQFVGNRMQRFIHRDGTPAVDVQPAPEAAANQPTIAVRALTAGERSEQATLRSLRQALYDDRAA